MEPLISISIILAVMILIVSLKLNLNYSILAGIILTSLLFNHGFFLFSDFVSTISSVSNISLILSFILIFFLARIMDEEGILKRMLVSAEKYIKKTWLVIISIPLLIGIVPTPSGAILSAPFVSEVGDKVKLTRVRQHLINYWFRHSCSEYINPIFPGVVLAASIAGITFGSFIFLNFPLMLFATATGFLFFIRGMPQRAIKVEEKSSADFVNIAKALVPILIALILPTVFKLNLAVSLFIAVALTIAMNKLLNKKLFSILLKSIKAEIILLIILILAFKTILENSKAIEMVASSFIKLNFPPIVLIIFIPMIIGFLTGVTMAYVGIGFPLLLPIMKTNGSLDLGLLMLAYEAGFFGLMMSPMHLCFSVTKNYFKLEYKEILNKLIIPQILVFGFAILLYYAGWPPS